MARFELDCVLADRSGPLKIWQKLYEYIAKYCSDSKLCVYRSLTQVLCNFGILLALASCFAFPAAVWASSIETGRVDLSEEVQPVGTYASIAGAIDFHIHSGPDVVRRSVDDFDVARMAALAGMRAVVIKNHFTPTAARAVLASKIVPEVEVFGGIVLNRSVGGINPEAVEVMAEMSGNRGKVVWLPTKDADYDHRKFHKSGDGIKVAENGILTRETEAVLKIIAREDLVLETGHISPAEVLAVVKRAKELGIDNILVTHPMTVVPGLSLEEMRNCAEIGAFLELVFLDNLKGENSRIAAYRNQPRVSIHQMAVAIREIGAEHFVLSTDLGRTMAPVPVEGYKRFVEGLRQEGIEQAEIDIMMKDNPAQLLGLS